MVYAMRKRLRGIRLLFSGGQDSLRSGRHMPEPDQLDVTAQNVDRVGQTYPGSDAYKPICSSSGPRILLSI